MKQKKIYYVAHPWDSRFSVENYIRVWKKFHPNFTFINPFYDVLKKNEVLNETRKVQYESGNPFVIVPQDLRLIDSCNELIAFVTGDLSYGTIMEIAYAHMRGKKVNIICTNGHEKHPWLVYHSMYENCSNMFTSVIDFEKEMDN